MSLIRALADVALRTVFVEAANTKVYEIEDAKEADRHVFERVNVRPYKRIYTAFVGANKIVFILTILFLVIPIPVYIIFNIVSFVTNPVTAVLSLVSTFSIVILYVVMFWLMGFILSLLHNPHIKRTGLGVDYDYLLRLRMKSSILLTLNEATGITSFKLSQVERFEKVDSSSVIVHFVKPDQWWKKLTTYTGLRLAFNTSEDAEYFYEVATRNLQNLEQNSEEIYKQKKINIEERKRVHKILYGRD